jgi:hypothetical protein
MKIGDLVRGKKNELLGYVTNARNDWCGSDWVMVYWFVIDAGSTRWINTDNLEVI